MVRFESEDDLSDAIFAAGDSFYHDDLEVPVLTIQTTPPSATALPVAGWESVCIRSGARPMAVLDGRPRRRINQPRERWLYDDSLLLLPADCPDTVSARFR